MRGCDREEAVFDDERNPLTILGCGIRFVPRVYVKMSDLITNKYHRSSPIYNKKHPNVPFKPEITSILVCRSSRVFHHQLELKTKQNLQI